MLLNYHVLYVKAFYYIYFQLGVALAKLFFLAEHEGLGLFLVACVPGGGAGHLLVSIIGADRSLSISINCANIFLAVGKSTLFVLYNSCLRVYMCRGGNFKYVHLAPDSNHNGFPHPHRSRVYHVFIIC